MNYNINDEHLEDYIVLGNEVSIRKANGTLEKRALFPNIDEVLLLENRALFIDNVYIDSFKNLLLSKSKTVNKNLKFNFSVLLSSLLLQKSLILALPGNFVVPLTIPISTVVAACLTKAKLDKNKSTQIVNSNFAVMELCSFEKLKCISERLKLLKGEIDESKIIRNEVIPICDDRDYSYQFVAREGLFDEYGKLEKKLLRKDKKDKLDEYLDSICYEEVDKLIINKLLDEAKSLKKTRNLNINRNK